MHRGKLSSLSIIQNLTRRNGGIERQQHTNQPSPGKTGGSIIGIPPFIVRLAHVNTDTAKMLMEVQMCIFARGWAAGPDRGRTSVGPKLHRRRKRSLHPLEGEGKCGMYCKYTEL